MELLISWNDLNEKDLHKIQAFTGAAVKRSFSKEEARSLVQTADVILGFVSPELLIDAKKCKWLQIPYAGAEKVLEAPWGNEEMFFSNGRGIFGPNIAEHVIGMILAFNRGLHVARDHQLQSRWEWETPYMFRELTGAKVGILGFGDIGQHIAKRLAGFDCEVIGFRRQPKGNEVNVQGVYPLDEVDNFLGELDYLVCALPHTSHTDGFLNRERLQKLPNHAYIINVGRGSLLPEQDLMIALQKKWVAGVGLDVTYQEPLPVESALWKMENVIITPHNSGYTPYHIERALAIFFENWEHFKKTGKPLRNLVDREWGY